MSRTCTHPRPAMPAGSARSDRGRPDHGHPGTRPAGARSLAVLALGLAAPVLGPALPAALLAASGTEAAAQSPSPPSRGPMIDLPSCLDAGSCSHLPLDPRPMPGAPGSLPIVIAPPPVDPSIVTWSNSFNEGLVTREREDRAPLPRTTPQGNRP